MRPNRGASLPDLLEPRFETCFCLGADATRAELDLSLYSDDISTVFLNGHRIAGPGGQFPRPEPLSVLYVEEDLGAGFFRPGEENCLQVEVRDLGGVVTGLNLAGTVSADHGACVAGVP